MSIYNGLIKLEANMDKVRILVSEDHNLVRRGLISIIENHKDFVIAGECEDGAGLVEKYSITKPDIVISDISMPNMGGIDAAKQILSIDSEAKIIFLTVFESDDYINKAIKIGAYGLISKQSLKEELIKTIIAVNSGKKYFQGKTDREVKDIERKFSDNSSVKSESHNELDKEMLELIAQGLTSEEIAEIKSESKRTIDAIRKEIMDKLNLKTLPQLIKYAVEFTYKAKEKCK